MVKIGIMGGTFNPVHNGHLLLGRQAYQEYALDEVWYMPSGQPPHKKGQTIASAHDRCEMIRLAIAGERRFKLSEFETSREGTTYTAQTLRLLRGTFPQYEFSFIIGADSLYEIENWYHPEEIFSMMPVLAAEREYEKAHRLMDEQISYLQSRFGARIRKLHCMELDISSSRIRGMARDGASLSGLVPDGVAAYIQEHHLYQEAAL